MKNKYSIFITIIILISCSKINNETQTYFGKYLSFPDSVASFNNAINIVNLNKSYAILGYLNGDCHVCVEQLNYLQDFLLKNELKKIKLIIIFYTQDLIFFEEMILPRLPNLNKNTFIYIDKYGNFGNKNNLVRNGKNYFFFLKNGEIVNRVKKLNVAFMRNILNMRG